MTLGPLRPFRNQLELVSVFAIAAIVSSTNLGQPPIYDEVYHILSARSWATEGSFRIADGVYDRAWIFTTIIAWFISLFGDSLVIFRLPSVLSGSCLVAAVFFWVRNFGGRIPAWIAAMCLCFYPDHILASHHIRFYSLHALCFWVGAVSIFSLAEVKTGILRSVVLAVLAVISFALALHFQGLTLIGMAAIAVWFMIMLLKKMKGTGQRESSNRLFLVLGVALAVGGSILLAGNMSQPVGELFESYRSATLWNAANRDRPYYYIFYFVKEYPTFFTLLPIAVLAAVKRSPAPAVFCSVIFVVCVMLLSFAGMKAPRYVYFAIPFFFVIWGLALAELFLPLRAGLSALVSGSFHSLLRNGLQTKAFQKLQLAIALLVALFLFVTNPAFPHAIRDVLKPEPKDQNWIAASKILRPWLDNVDVVVVSDPKFYTLYYLGRSDVFIGSGERRFREFEVDTRTGKPIISTVASMKRLVNCYSTGLIIAPAKKWRNSSFVNEELAEFITRSAVKIPMQEKWGIKAFRWEGARQERRNSCGDLPKPREG